MESSDFPGYSRCKICQTLLSAQEIHKHILNCRPIISNEKKLCTLCDKQIAINQFEEHIENCDEQSSSINKSFDNLNSTNNNEDYHTPRAQSPLQDKKISSKSIVNISNKQIKVCIICSEEIPEEDYGKHVQFCSNDNQTNQTSTISKSKICPFCSEEIDQLDYQNHLQYCSNDHKINSFQNSFNSSKNVSKSKICPFCSKEINQFEYENHFQFCSNNSSEKSFQTNSSQKNLNEKQRKLCVLCSQLIDQFEYEKHVENCSNENSSPLNQSTTNKEKKSCEYCFEKINQSDYSNHILNCLKQISNNKKKIFKKECIICSELVDESDYIEHVTCCSSEQDSKMSSHNNKKQKQQENLKECVICSKLIGKFEYINHVQSCSAENPISSNDQTKSSANGKRQDCIMCFKSIDSSEYENHVLSCLAQTEEGTNSKKRNHFQCLTCNRQINKENDMYHQMSCDLNHIHCLSCLRQSMEEFARNRQAPTCHSILCDYQLSKHDISSIPIERRLSDRLLKLVKGEQRPLCPKCLFYINDNFDEHIDLCNDLIPCEYCHLPYSFNQLENHSEQCRSDPISLNEKLIHFILPRTKYPFNKQQITIFIQEQKKNSINDLNPHSIIDALAVYGRIFPYEIPTRECGICMESRPYDDIYVFDCPDSHKICYECYYQSCETKMNSGEILTCALCTHPLRDGELNQLRIPLNQLQKIRDYQMKKTFDIYSSRTKGIIKCPNQNCSWVAEAEDPNERFKVTCPQCQREFCSLCNQQYHYRTTCQQLPQITQRWFFWCENERQRYLTMRAQQDAQYAQQLEDYNKQTNENNTRNNDLRRRYQELMNDEQYKVQNCRLCPSCKRVVQRLEGCDSMVCGQDAHGGNLQSGCGTKFNWAQAQPYSATATQQPKQIILDLPKPDNPIVHHYGIKCDQCQNDINGIRFDCVHCPSLTFCEKCERQATLNHSQENQAFQQQQHVFKLIMMPEEEAMQF